MSRTAEHAAIDRIAQRLGRQFDTLDPVDVHRVVWTTYRHFDHHRSRDDVPTLVQDLARDRLRVSAQAPSVPVRTGRPIQP